MNKPKLFYTWQEFDKDIDSLAKKLKKEKIKNILAIPRGGYVLAVALSHRLNIPILWQESEWWKTISKNTLVVDDICDSGKTLQKLFRELDLPKCKTAVLFWRQNDKFEPDFFADELLDKLVWVVMPWETKKSSRHDFTI